MVCDDVIPRFKRGTCQGALNMECAVRSGHAEGGQLRILPSAQTSFPGRTVEKSRGGIAEAFDDVAADVAEALAECLPRQPQDLGGLELIGVGELQDGREENAIDFELNLGVQVRASRLEASANEVSEDRPTFVRNSARCTLSAIFARRSEEHTSELQSPCNLVC